jgi:hypothetical protein
VLASSEVCRILRTSVAETFVAGVREAGGDPDLLVAAFEAAAGRRVERGGGGPALDIAGVKAVMAAVPANDSNLALGGVYYVAVSHDDEVSLVEEVLLDKFGVAGKFAGRLPSYELTVHPKGRGASSSTDTFSSRFKALPETQRKGATLYTCPLAVVPLGGFGHELDATVARQLRLGIEAFVTLANAP